MRPGSNGGHQHGRNGTGNAWHRVVLCNPEAVVTPFLGPLGPFQHPVQGVRSRKPVPCVGTVENGNPGKGKGHTLGTTPGEEEFRSGTRVRSPGPGTVQPHVCGRPRAGPRVPRSRVLSRSCGTHGRGGGARVDVSSPGPAQSARGRVRGQSRGERRPRHCYKPWTKLTKRALHDSSRRARFSDTYLEECQLASDPTED